MAAHTGRVAGVLAIILVLILAGFVAATVMGLAKLPPEQFNLLLVAINGALGPALGFYFTAQQRAAQRGTDQPGAIPPPAPPAPDTGPAKPGG